MWDWIIQYWAQALFGIILGVAMTIWSDVLPVEITPIKGVDKE